ncbi:hypothetical protein [Amycolatopsis sp. NPDC001319]|uniref:hypothetical protein n=1 Tax=unclassified Amycolatopsis TaxID=2618356 RepID=UPI0036962067
MGVLEFISSLVSSLAWPVVVTTLVIVLRKPIARLLTARPLKSFKAGPGGLELHYLDEKLEAAAAHISEAKEPRGEAHEQAHAEAGEHREQVGADGDDVRPGEGETDAERSTEDAYRITDEMTDLVRVSPPAAVLLSFAQLEQAVRDAAAAHPNLGRQFGVKQPVRTVAKEVFSSSEYAAFVDLASVRNKVSHAVDDGSRFIDSDRALQYVTLAKELSKSAAAAPSDELVLSDRQDQSHS